MADHSTTPSVKRKRRCPNLPPKPRKDFPLTPHPAGYWCKKILKKVHYFGRWGRRINGKLVRVEGDGWEAAKALYDLQIDDLLAGRKPRITSLEQAAKDGRTAQTESADPDIITVMDLCNAFLTFKQGKLHAGEIGERMFNEYKATTTLLIKQFGEHAAVDELQALDFQRLREHMASKWGPTRLTNAIVRVKSVFAYAYEVELLTNPIRCLGKNSTVFSPPSTDVIRKLRASKPKHELTPEECRTLLDAAPAPLDAMILLGLNCGFGSHDCALLKLADLNLDKAMLEFPRPKTGIERRCPLWPETVKALRDAIAKRPTPKLEEAKGLVFVTSRGRPWLSKGIANPICQAVRQLMRVADVHRQGFGQYTFRKVFRTKADEAKDQPACDLIMGHTDGSMAGRYRQSISDERLQAVTDHVRGWVFGNAKPRKPK